jgi:hypothetical protein
MPLKLIVRYPVIEVMVYLQQKYRSLDFRMSTFSILGSLKEPILLAIRIIVWNRHLTRNSFTSIF